MSVVKMSLICLILALSFLPVQSAWAKADQVVRGDFDGDGKVDKASLFSNGTLVSCGKRIPKGELRVWLSSFNQDRVAHIIRNYYPNDSEFTITRVGPGTYKEACTKGYGPDCSESWVRKTLKLDHDAIKFIYEEKSSGLYYWNGHEFVRFWLSD